MLVTIKAETMWNPIARWVSLSRERREEITGGSNDSDWYACKLDDGRYLRFRNDGKVELRCKDYYTVQTVFDDYPF